MNRLVCGGCGEPQLVSVLDLGATPLADRFPADPEELEATYPLEAVVCTRCWLMQLSYVVDDKTLWGDDYGFHAGSSPGLVAANRALADWLLPTHPGSVLEVACNDGDLLQHFAHAGRKVLGIDPAAGPVAVARDRGLPVMQAMFEPETAAEIRDEHGSFRLILARNVVAHVADLTGFMSSLRLLCADDGAVVLEYQSLADLLAGCQFDHLYHEHRQFFSVSTMARLAKHHGFSVTGIDHIEAQGGSIRMELRPGPGRNNPELSDWLAAEQRYGLQELGTYRSFAARAHHTRDRLNDILTGELLGATLAGYGATAKSCTLLHWLDAGPDLLECVEDTTPAKLGRYTPGTKIPIAHPDTREQVQPDAFLVLAWNYLPGILQRERVWMATGGRLLVPIPMPVVL